MPRKYMVNIREFLESNFSSVKFIYLQGIETGNATFQQEAKEWEEWNASLLPVCRLVAELKGTIVGWAALSPVSDRCVCSGVAEVSVYIASGRGIGCSLLRNWWQRPKKKVSGLYKRVFFLKTSQA